MILILSEAEQHHLKQVLVIATCPASYPSFDAWNRALRSQVSALTGPEAVVLDPAESSGTRADALWRLLQPGVESARRSAEGLFRQPLRLMPASSPITPQRPTRTAEPDVRSVQARYSLTRRESEVAGLLAAGHRNRDIAAELGISEHTARRHTERVLEKTGAPTRARLVALLAVPA